MRVGVVIPAYNAGESLAEVVRKCVREVGRELVIVVNDGSTDSSCNPERLSGVTCIDHPENRGKGAALKTGFREAMARGFEAIVMLDADGQHDPVLIPALVREAQSTDADIVVGTRMGNVGGMPWLRRTTNRTTSFLVSLLVGQRIEDSQSGFRLIRTRRLGELDLKTNRYDTESEMLIQAGRKGLVIRSAPIPSVYGDEKSCIQPVADTGRFIRLFFRYLFRRNRE
ncbi:MAG: glycosyltransferase family 2 protein [Candidatus Eisenbacteria sp.]|nr:glycosyltransferase family 2 protein [Candidatus Eisenbacteria bacterium]